MQNIVSFDIKKTETILFIIIKKNLLIKLTKNNKFSIGSKEIKFNINICQNVGRNTVVARRSVF